jgi:hypothetical protein
LSGGVTITNATTTNATTTSFNHQSLCYQCNFN